ncbi:MAG TPA: cardiolipin synthase [bacterium]
MTHLAPILIYVFLFLVGIFSAGHAILYKRDPRAGFGWLVTCLVFIGIGPLLYWLFGINRIRTHAQRLYRLGHWKHETKTGREKWSFNLPKDHSFYLNNFKEILNVSERVNRHPLMVGNRIENLFNGEEAYPAMLEAIEKAQKFIYLCTYIFDSDEIGRKFVEALAKAKMRGVEVWVLVDAFGERYSNPPISRVLKQKKINVARFLPLSFSPNTLHLNLRNHRKLLVVDGQIGFTGGLNIRGRHFVNSTVPNRAISDIHFKIEGPVVLELQEVFLEDWYFATKESLSWLSHPHNLLPGDSVCRTISGGPNEDFEKINWILLGALASAKKKIQIMTPYFVPDRVMIAALNTAALRGVSVEVILPQKNNIPFIAWASRALLWEMLENGVQFYYQPPPFAHSKLFIADESYVLIGSSNWDARSLRLNFELDIEIYDPLFAQSLSQYFKKVLSQSKKTTLAEVNRDPFLLKFRNAFLKLFSPYL